MESRLIYKASEHHRSKIDWIRQGESEWIYCGSKGEVKFETVGNELKDFFKSDKFFIAKTRNDSFESTPENLLSSVIEIVGARDFFIWDEAFQMVVEFSKIGVFRKGVTDVNTNNPVFKINYNRMAPGSPDKVKGKLVRYRKGDCLSIDCGNGNYLAAFISEKFNKYYDLTLIEYLKEVKPSVADFVNGRFFGKYGRSMDEIFPAIQKNMRECLELDTDVSIEKVGSIELIEPLPLGSYGYTKDNADLLHHYKGDLPQRRANTAKYGQVFIEPLEQMNGGSDRLIEMSNIVQNKEV